MENQNEITTPRLHLEKLSEHDAPFIHELLNTEGWLKFIGTRNINSVEDATAYIKKINNNHNISYWTVRLKDNTPIGMVTLIQRDYLEHKDIGFAFLPGYAGQGYAYEAAKAVMDHLIASNAITHVLAQTLPENVSSIKLIEKLGLKFWKKMEVDGEEMNLYSGSLEEAGKKV